MFALNQVVKWKDCPGSIWMFELTRVRGMSPCGQYFLLSWINSPISIDSLVAAEDPTNSLRNYHPVKTNHWGDDGKDKSTGQDLTRWTYERNQRRRRTANNGGSSPR